jgi:glycosyltransferase involved in cell wall biosynthesis
VTGREAELEDDVRLPRLVSIVMPVRNEEEHVGEQLAALAAQTYSGDWELVVVDNGSDDRTAEIVWAWRDRLPAVQVIDATPPGLNIARNRGAAAARGDFLAFCDGDNVADPGWLEALVDAAADADLVAGRHDLDLLNDELTLPWAPRKSSQQCLVRSFHFLPYAPGGNMGIWVSLARELGWDEDFRFGGSDAEFSWRLELRGGRVKAAPEALMHRRLRPTMRGMVRQTYAYGKGGPLLYRKFREYGMPRHLGEARFFWGWLIFRWRALFRSRGQRGRWLQVASLRVGRLVGSLRYRTFFP